MPATGAVSLADAFASDDDTAGREVGSGDDLHQVFHADLIELVKAVDEQIEGGYQLAQVVRRNVGCHADCDTVRAIHQQVGDAGR